MKKNDKTLRDLVLGLAMVLTIGGLAATNSLSGPEASAQGIEVIVEGEDGLTLTAELTDTDEDGVSNSLFVSCASDIGCVEIDVTSDDVVLEFELDCEGDTFCSADVELPEGTFDIEMEVDDINQQELEALFEVTSILDLCPELAGESDTGCPDAFELKEDALDELDELFEEGISKKDLKRLEDGRRELLDSMGPDAGGSDPHAIWETEYSISCQWGHKVFDHEKQAIEHLRKVQDEYLAEEIEEDVIAFMVEADRILAETAIAQSPEGKNKDKAVSAFDKAENASNLKQKIHKYRMAWKYADKNCVESEDIVTTLEILDVSDGGDGFTDSFRLTCTSDIGCKEIRAGEVGGEETVFPCPTQGDCIIQEVFESTGILDVFFYGVDLNDAAEDPVNFTTIEITDECPYLPGPDTSDGCPLPVTTLEILDVSDGGDGFTDSFRFTCTTDAYGGCAEVRFGEVGGEEEVIPCVTRDIVCVIQDVVDFTGTLDVFFYGVDRDGREEEPNFATVTFTDECPEEAGPDSGCPAPPVTTLEILDVSDGGDGFTDSFRFTCTSTVGCAEVRAGEVGGEENVLPCATKETCIIQDVFGSTGTFDVFFYGVDLDGRIEETNFATVTFTDECPEEAGPDSGCPISSCPSECDQTANNYCSHYSGSERGTVECPVECDSDCGTTECSELPAFCGTGDSACPTEGCNRACDLDCNVS